MGKYAESNKVLLVEPIELECISRREALVRKRGRSRGLRLLDCLDDTHNDTDEQHDGEQIYDPRQFFVYTLLPSNEQQREQQGL